MLAIALIIGVTLYAALAGMLYLGQERLLFQPNLLGRTLDATPLDLKLAYRDVQLATADGETLHGWIIPSGRPGRLLVFFHGNAGNISHRLESIRMFHELGVDVLIVDYRGYGRSTGRPSERGLRQDALAVWRHATDELGYAPESTVLFGRSLGGAVAARLASRVRPAALIVESSFTSVADIAAELYPLFPVRLLTHLQFDTSRALQRVLCPVLVVHSVDDEIIPYQHGRALFEAAGNRARLLPIRGPHNGGFLQTGQPYIDGIRDFLTDHLAPPQRLAPLDS